MQNLLCKSIIGLCLTVILTACATATPASLPISPTLQPTLPTSTPIPTLEPVGAGIPVVEYLNEQNELLVISSVTGKPFNEFPPIPLGTYYSYAFSPDGKILAVVSSAQLYLIDLLSWKYLTSEVDLHGPISSVVYSPDGTLLALAGGLPRGELRIVDVKSGAVKAHTQAGFSIRTVKFTTDGKALMIYGPHLIADVSIEAPKAALFAVSDLSVIWLVDLNGIRHGIFPKKAGTLDIYQPGAAWHFEPGIAFAPNHDMLYVVHGDEDKLTTVDFINQKVSTVNVQVKTSWLNQLLALTASVAHAKGMDGAVKQAVISSDGKFLFVAGNTEVVTQQANGNDWDITDTSIGLQVIASENGTLVDKISTDASSVRLSPDSKQLFLTGWNNGIPWTDIYDISSEGIIKHLDGIYLIPSRRLDRKAILVSINTISSNVSYTALIDPETWTIVSDWKGVVDVGWLIDP